ncbi:hypothetical protein [Bradyrhizobium sp. JR3.5]
MKKPNLDPDVADIAPVELVLTTYDGEHLMTHWRLLDVESDLPPGKTSLGSCHTIEGPGALAVGLVGIWRAQDGWPATITAAYFAAARPNSKIRRPEFANDNSVPQRARPSSVVRNRSANRHELAFKARQPRQTSKKRSRRMPDGNRFRRELFLHNDNRIATMIL